MHIIGLTGNIATGKSTVAWMLRELGAEVIDADKLAHYVMRAGTNVNARVVGRFGCDVVTAQGEIDRKKLGAIVFSDPNALRDLETIVHPEVLAETWKRLAESDRPVRVVEAIKLIGAGLSERCDSIWVVTCSRDQQIRRLVANRGLSDDEAIQRIAAQSAPELKLARADVIIDNSSSLCGTRCQVRAAWESAVSGRAPDRPGGARPEGDKGDGGSA